MKFLKLISLSLLILLGGLILFPEAKYAPYTPDDSYLADSANYNVPPMPEDWTWSYFATWDDTKIRWGQTERRDGEPSVLLIPGYTSSMDMYGEHVSMLAARGYHVLGLDLRGQGGSDRHRSIQPEKLYANNFGVYSDDVAELIDSLTFLKERPFVIIGSSFGGHVALRLVGDHDTTVDGLVLLAPAYVPNTAPFSVGLTKTMTGFAKLIGKDQHYAPGLGDWRPDGTDLTVGSDCASDPTRLYLRDTVFVRKPEQRVGGATNNYVRGMIKSGELLRSESYAAKLDIPIHMVVAEKDVIIDSAVSEAACMEGLPDCKLVKLPGTGHCLMLENDTVINAIYDEVDALIARLKD
jgi:lysophospholipase